MYALTNILIVDDDTSLCKLLKELLSRQGFMVFVAHDSQEAEDLVKTKQLDLIILDLVLPGEKDGIALCKALHEISPVPIIMLSGMTEDVERILSLEMGADYYVTKPFNSRVLLAHIHAALRRSRLENKDKPELSSLAAEMIAVQHHIYEFSDWCLNTTTRILLSAENKLIKLTAAEYTLLKTLLDHSQRVLSREQLINLTKMHSDSFDRSIDILISRLRAKLNNKLITTIRNGGYMLSSGVKKQIIDNEAWLKLTMVTVDEA